MSDCCGLEVETEMDQTFRSDILVWKRFLYQGTNQKKYIDARIEEDNGKYVDVLLDTPLCFRKDQIEKAAEMMALKSFPLEKVCRILSLDSRETYIRFFKENPYNKEITLDRVITTEEAAKLSAKDFFAS